MAGLTLDAAKCVRALSTFSECNRCELICPTEAIELTQMLPSINLAACVGCGGCAGVCPTEALKLDDFNPTAFFFAFASDDDKLLSCRKNVPCISVLNVEHIIALASLKEGLVCDMGHCEGCAVASHCQPQIEANAHEANYLLEAMENPARVVLESVAYLNDDSAKTEDDRRDFFRAFTLENAFKAQHGFEREVQIATDEQLEQTLQISDIATIKKRELPQKRKLFYTALKRAPKPSTYHIVDATAISFTSQKLLDIDACTACQMCYRICPTGALSSDIRHSRIDFDPFMCLQCHLCHDVCEPQCLTLSPSYNVKEFFEPSVLNLVRFSVRNCDECMAAFVSLHGGRLCNRCKIEEEEARELWGIPE